MANSLVEILEAALEIEAHATLGYVVDEATPSVVDDGDARDLEILQGCWDAERAHLEKLAEAIVDAGGDPEIRRAYPFALARLNYDRPSYLLETIQPLVKDEIARLEALQAALETSIPASEVLNALIETKTSGLDAIAAAAEKARERREAEAAGQAVEVETKSEPSDLEFPWKDPDMPIADRLAAARDGGKFEKLFAAMAQTDCTACGYDCEGYARAIADGEEDDLGKCVPGEDETAEALKKILGS